MNLNDRLSRFPRRAAVLAAAVPAALLVSGLATGVASAAPGDDITDQCIETSQNGSPWVGLDEFNPKGTGYIPVPGDEDVQLAFDVRNKCDVPATLTIYSENWVVTKDATATVRGAIDGVEGQQVTIGPGKDASTRIVLQQKVLLKNVTTPVEYILGIPWEEEAQGFGISPGWGFVLTEDPADPGIDGSCGANGSVVGSLDSIGSVGALASLGSTGSLGSVTGSLCNDTGSGSGSGLGSLVDRD